MKELAKIITNIPPSSNLLPFCTMITKSRKLPFALQLNNVRSSTDCSALNFATQSVQQVSGKCGHSESCFPGGSNGKESACDAEDQVQSLHGENPLEKEMATHANILAWRIPWTEIVWWATVYWVAKRRYDLAIKPPHKAFKNCVF